MFEHEIEEYYYPVAIQKLMISNKFLIKSVNLPSCLHWIKFSDDSKYVQNASNKFN